MPFDSVSLFEEEERIEVSELSLPKRTFEGIWGELVDFLRLSELVSYGDDLGDTLGMLFSTGKETRRLRGTEFAGVGDDTACWSEGEESELSSDSNSSDVLKLYDKCLNADFTGGLEGEE